MEKLLIEQVMRQSIKQHFIFIRTKILSAPYTKASILFFIATTIIAEDNSTNITYLFKFLIKKLRFVQSSLS